MMQVLRGPVMVGLVGLRENEWLGPTGCLKPSGGSGLGVMLGGLDLGTGSGGASSTCVRTAGWTSGLAAGQFHEDVRNPAPFHE